MRRAHQGISLMKLVVQASPSITITKCGCSCSCTQAGENCCQQNTFLRYEESFFSRKLTSILWMPSPQHPLHSDTMQDAEVHFISGESNSERIAHLISEDSFWLLIVRLVSCSFHKFSWSLVCAHKNERTLSSTENNARVPLHSSLAISQPISGWITLWKLWIVFTSRFREKVHGEWIVQSKRSPRWVGNPAEVVQRNLFRQTRSGDLGRGWAQKISMLRLKAIHWMAGTSSVNCLSCRIPYQCLHSLNACTPFSEKALFFTDFCFVASPSQKSSVPMSPWMLQCRLQDFHWAREFIDKVHVNVVSFWYVRVLEWGFGPKYAVVLVADKLGGCCDSFVHTEHSGASTLRELQKEAMEGEQGYWQACQKRRVIALSKAESQAYQWSLFSKAERPPRSF